MAIFCLPKDKALALKKALKRGELNPDKLSAMTSVARRSLLAKIVGNADAKELNLSFEKKSLLVNEERAMVDWVKDSTGMSKEQKIATTAKIKKTYEEKKRRVYDPKESEQFLNEITSDVFSKKYKADVTLEEAQTITELSQNTSIAREKMNPDFTWETPKDGLDFGASKVALDNYTGALKLKATKAELVNPLKRPGILSKADAVIQDIKVAANFIADNSRSLKASYDNSFFGRQGIKVLLNPRYAKDWGRNFIKSWSDIYKTLKGGNKAGDAIIDATKAEIYSRKNYLNGRYELGRKLDIGTGEEEFPTSFPSKIPVLGRGFRASEVAYEAGAMRLRVDVADKMYDMAEKNGVALTDKFETGSINQLVNSMTGRGKVPLGEKGQKAINKTFFSIKKVKSDIDFLTDMFKSGKSEFVRKQAALNLLTVVSSLGVMLKIAQTLWPDDNKDIFNPTSSNFAKIRIGWVRFDPTGGMGGLVVLAAKILSQRTTSTTTGITKKLGEGYGTQDGMDVIWNFTEGKFAPATATVKNIIKQKTFDYKKPTIKSETVSLTVPITIENIHELKDEPMGMQLAGLIADGLGINVTAYTPSEDWSESKTQEIQKFKSKVSEKQFKKANDEFNKIYSNQLLKLRKDKFFDKLSDEKKQKVITSKKRDIKKYILGKY